MSESKTLFKFIKDFAKNYNKESDEGYFLEVVVQCPKNLHNLHNGLPYLLERKKIEKVEKLLANLCDKTEYEYVTHITHLKQALNHELFLKKIHTVIKFNQNAWLKSYIDMYTELKTKVKKDFEKDFFNLMNNEIFGNTIENVKKQRDIKLVTTERMRKILVLQSFS